MGLNYLLSFIGLGSYFADREREIRQASVPVIDERELARLKRIESRSKFPPMEFTMAEYDALPRSEDLIEEFGERHLYSANIGLKFKCTGGEKLEDTVVGHLVKGNDAICEQYGAGLFVPERFVNRYEPVIVDG